MSLEEIFSVGNPNACNYTFCCCVGNVWCCFQRNTIKSLQNKSTKVNTFIFSQEYLKKTTLLTPDSQYILDNDLDVEALCKQFYERAESMQQECNMCKTIKSEIVKKGDRPVPFSNRLTDVVLRDQEQEHSFTNSLRKRCTDVANLNENSTDKVNISRICDCCVKRQDLLSKMNPFEIALVESGKLIEYLEHIADNHPHIAGMDTVKIATVLEQCAMYDSRSGVQKDGMITLKDLIDRSENKSDSKQLLTINLGHIVSMTNIALMTGNSKLLQILHDLIDHRDIDLGLLKRGSIKYEYIAQLGESKSIEMHDTLIKLDRFNKHMNDYTTQHLISDTAVIFRNIKLFDRILVESIGKCAINKVFLQDDLAFVKLLQKRKVHMSVEKKIITGMIRSRFDCSYYLPDTRDAIEQTTQNKEYKIIKYLSKSSQGKQIVQNHDLGLFDIKYLFKYGLTPKHWADAILALCTIIYLLIFIVLLSRGMKGCAMIYLFLFIFGVGMLCRSYLRYCDVKLPSLF